MVPPNEARLHAALRRLECTPTLARSPAMRRALAYLVAAELAGNGPQLTAYRVAVEAFGRPADFDPSASASVRVEMNRLRRVLMADRERLPEADGIAIAAASYRPELAPGRPKPTVVHLRTALPTGPALAVLPSLRASDEVPQHVRVGTMQFLLEALTRARELYIVQPHDLDAGDPELLARCVDRHECQFVLTGSVATGGAAGSHAIRLVLHDAVAAREIWSRQYRLSAADMLDDMADIAGDVARQITDPVGIITMYSARRVYAQPISDDLSTADLLLRFRLYRAFQRDPATHLQLRTQVERLVAAEPWFALGWMMHGLLVLDEHANRYNPTGRGDAVGAARVSLEQALAIDPDLAKATFGLSHVAYFERDLPRCVDYLQRALDMNPNDLEFRQTGAMDLCLGGAIDDGLRLIERGGQLEHAAPTYRLNAAMCMYAAGDHAAAARIASRLPQEIPRYLAQLVLAICYGAFGDHARAAQSLARAFVLEPDLRSDLHEEMDKWILEPGLAARTKRLLDVLRTYLRPDR